MRNEFKNVRMAVRREDWENNHLAEDNIKVEAPFTDLVFYPEVVMDYMGNTIAGAIPKALLDDLGMTEEDLLALACRNTEDEAEIFWIEEVLFGERSDDPLPILVITSHDKVHGAGSIFSKNVLRRAMAVLEDAKIYLLPSSIHEVLAVPASMVEERGLSGLTEMIQEINAFVVETEEQLSDHPYVFDGENLRVA